MGNLSEDIVKMQLAKSHLSNLIEEAQKDRTCDNCGRHFDRTKGGKCMKGGWGCDKENLCPKCMNICRKCHKVFCDNHINNHKCR